MIKSIGALLGGIFIGAVGMEIVRRMCPGAVDKFYSGVREVSSGAKEAFRKGYANAARPEAAVGPST